MSDSSPPASPIDEHLLKRLEADLIDGYDEELELELEDRNVDALSGQDEADPEGLRLARQTYFRELFRLQGELVKLQDWVAHTGEKVVIVFEGRDAAGKGGIIKRITQRLNPRIARVVALPAPSSRERTQWYFQRYVSHLPAAGEMVLFDRSWYNRAGVERVMGFCSEADVEEFFRSVPEFERMLERTHIAEAPWWVVQAVDKKRARLNCIAHLLTLMPYEEMAKPTVELPERVRHPDYIRQPVTAEMIVPEVY